MASTAHALLAAIAGLILWTGTGLMVARSLSWNRALDLPLAPALGWAVQTVLALTLSLIFGLSAWTILGATLLICATAWGRGAGRSDARAAVGRLSPWIVLAAALIAVLPAASVLPKIVADGVLVAAPIYDHAKIALTAEIIRSGVPPINPIFVETGAPQGVAYYYLWHFGAAQLARLTGASAWEADIACTWFTAAASLWLMCGIASVLARNWIAPAFVLIASATGSLRPVLALLLGRTERDHWLQSATGLAGWVFQTSWSPHHVAAATSTLIAALMMADLAMRPTVRTASVLALVVAAGFQSSLWVGGVTFGLAGIAMALVLVVAAPPSARVGFITACAASALVAVTLSTPLLMEQIRAAASRGGGTPIVIAPAPVLGEAFPIALRAILDPPAFWLVLLAIEFPVLLLGAGLSLGRSRVATAPDPDCGLLVAALMALAWVSLGAGWLLVSTAGENNDLGWRAVLPGVLVLSVIAGVGASRGLARWPVPTASALAIVIAAALPDNAKVIADNIRGDSRPSSAAFARSPRMWEAVRRHAAPDDRVANNPAFLRDLTPWPVNLSWALLADRRSCFAGNELALAFAPLSMARRTEISDLFLRVFAGEGTEADVALLAGRYGCDVVVVSVLDGAWSRDPFGSGPLYRLAESAAGEWRIYVRVR